MKTIDLVYFDAGGGHRAAATALSELAREQQRPWRVRLVNLVKVLDPESRFRRIAGFEPEDYYNMRLRRGWTLGLAQELKLLQAMIRLGHMPMVKAFTHHWRASRPDLVVSLVPNFNRALAQAVRRALPGVRFATVLTDLADVPPSFWIEPAEAQWLVCGTARAVEQALLAGVAPERIHQVSGMILRPAFYREPTVDRAEARRALGLDAAAALGLVMFGGHGSMQMLRIAKALPSMPLLFACGHNAALAADLRALRRPAPHVATGFTQDMPSLMRLADFFIGKPGPGSLSEAVQAGLPVLTFDNAWTMPQERYNVEWVHTLGLGLAVRSVRGLPRACERLMADLGGFQQRVRAQRNRAVYEVLDLLDQWLRETSPMTAVQG